MTWKCGTLNESNVSQVLMLPSLENAHALWKRRKISHNYIFPSGLHLKKKSSTQICNTGKSLRLLREWLRFCRKCFWRENRQWVSTPSHTLVNTIFFFLSFFFFNYCTENFTRWFLKADLWTNWALLLCRGTKTFFIGPQLRHIPVWWRWLIPHMLSWTEIFILNTT